MGMPPITGSELLIIREVISTGPIVTGFVDRSKYLHFGDAPTSLGGSERTSFGAVLGQRSQANIALNAKASDNYQPQVGWQVFLYEVTDISQICVFSGVIGKVQTSWWGLNGDRLISLSCVSFEQIFDEIRVPGTLYQGKTAGFIVNDLLGLADGWPGTVGTVDDGVNVDTFLIKDEPTLGSLFSKLASLSSFIWYVDPTNLQFNFVPPGLIAAPFVLQQTDPLFECMDIISDEHDFRDRQYVKIDPAYLGESAEVFIGDGVSTQFTLRNPVDTVNDAWITRNTQNTATGTMSTQPSPGDTVSIGYPSSGSTYNWAPNSPYAVGYTIVDPANHLQKVTAVSGLSPSGSGFGQSGSTQPTWNDSGGTTNDNGLVWTDQGILGFSGGVIGLYTFVTSLDNTQYGQVLIGVSAASTLQNLIDAINSTTGTRGISYSLPTWENALVNADAPSGSTFTVRNKVAGRGYIAALTATGSAFSWSANLTSGGITTFNTVSLSVGVNSPGARTTSLSYTPGSPVVTLPSPLNVGTNLEVGYYRLDAGIIGVEDTSLVGDRAAIESSTGKYQALTTDDIAVTPAAALIAAQAALAAFSVIPKTFEFITFRTGLQVGMSLSVGFTMPAGPNIEQG